MFSKTPLRYRNTQSLNATRPPGEGFSFLFGAVRRPGPCSSTTLSDRVVEGHRKLWWAMPTLRKNCGGQCPPYEKTINYPLSTIHYPKSN